MYVTPAPRVSEDPLYAVRLGATGLLSCAAIPILDPALPAIIAALPVGLVASQRKAMNLGKAIGGPIAMIVMVWLMTSLIELLRPMPLVFVLVMWWVYFIGFRMILQTGAQAGMLIVVVAVLVSVMGMNGNATVEVLRDGFTQASLVALVVGPLVYALFPPNTKEQHVDEPTPAEGGVVTGAIVRATVLLVLSFWLYTVMQPSDMMMAVIAAMVLVFPTRHAVFYEASQRIRATAYGGALALVILVLFSYLQYLTVVLGLIFLGGLFLGTRMLDGKHPSMVYQYAFSVSLALIAGALSTQDAGYATFTRLVLTVGGALSAAFLVALLDALTNWQKEPDNPAPIDNSKPVAEAK
ncbi:MAG: FUSC family protein [Gammaproteobacteria bacterium]|uniref:Integral membrane bound transporter domain-containing protein n=1 Tax=Marinobacter litoralis TaxID=187981 RepID=A0A3M2RGG4_9GAMM|nr:FUSC family protein [Marinobacter litoralis]MBR9870406.1 FUSC family protein [Gammaproteobacteria bacterium]RMJ04391.1 hypothetical protein DOQ08_01712 [Marinobacter litoralis]